MTLPPEPRPMAILKATDPEASIAWYQAAGFTLRSRVDMDESVWWEVARDATVLQFLAGATPWDGDPALTGCFYVYVEGIDAAFAALQPPVSSEWGVEDREWGAREVVLRDPDGYIVTLTETDVDAL